MPDPASCPGSDADHLDAARQDRLRPDAVRQDLQRRVGPAVEASPGWERTGCCRAGHPHAEDGPCPDSARRDCCPDAGLRGVGRRDAGRDRLPHRPGADPVPRAARQRAADRERRGAVRQGPPGQLPRPARPERPGSSVRTARSGPAHSRGGQEQPGQQEQPGPTQPVPSGEPVQACRQRQPGRAPEPVRAESARARSAPVRLVPPQLRLGSPERESLPEQPQPQASGWRAWGRSPRPYEPLAPRSSRTLT